MIGLILGSVRDVKSGLANIISNGLGYEVHVNERDYDSQSEFYPFDNPVWWIHEVAPQDAPHELYGFREREERDLFRKLLTIKGVGPTVAMRIAGERSKLFFSGKSFQHSDLTGIRGVGATLAQRICEAMQ